MTRSATGSSRRSSRAPSRRARRSRHAGWQPKQRGSNCSSSNCAARPADGRGHCLPRRQPWLSVTNAENSYDYAGQDAINGYDLNGTCYRGTPRAAGLNLDVAGKDKRLCRKVDRIFNQCYVHYYRTHPNGGLSELYVWGQCWDYVDKRFGHRAGLWDAEPLRHNFETCSAANQIGFGFISGVIGMLWPPGWIPGFGYVVYCNTR